MIGILTRDSNDIEEILKKNHVAFAKIGENLEGIEDVDSLLILGGTRENPYTLEPVERNKVEAFISSGKKVFAEYVRSIGEINTDGHILSRYERAAYVGKREMSSLKPLDIMDNQCTMRMRPFGEILKTRTPLFMFTSEHVHKNMESAPSLDLVEDFALFFERENVLYSSMQLSNFNQNRYAPMKKINDLIKWILEWVSGEEIDLGILGQNYTLSKITGKLEEDTLSASLKAIEWIEINDFLLDEGKRGVREGYGTEIYTDGRQRISETIRTDCIGEVSLLYYLTGRLTGNERNIKVSENLVAFGLNELMVNEGENKGMLRWCDIAFDSCYGDDAARFIIPVLLKNLLSDENNNEELLKIKNALDFLISTTGKDGLRISRTENGLLTDEAKGNMQNEKLQSASAHYNAYYHGALILYYLLTKEEKYLETGKTGLETLMGLYPETVREQSQTEEEARLVFPLALLSLATGKAKHKNYLNNVIEDLEKRKHPLGCYLEWDEEYHAVMRNTMKEGECSLLSKNGDEVVDLLYTNNWLPLGFFFAMISSGDEKHHALYQEISTFMVEIQMKSSRKELDGAWARGFDPGLMEYFGSPADSGWGPYAIETGWTVGEIASGILFGHLKTEVLKKLKK